MKTILEKLGEVALSRDTGFWKIELDYDNITVDFQTYLQIVGDKEYLDKLKIIQLALITQAGNFLTNIEYPWLETFKSEVSNKIIDTYLRFAHVTHTAYDPEFLLQIAQYIFNFDPVNEDAMIIKCKALAHLGKHTLAKNAFESFAKEYKQIYGEDFSRSLQSVIDS